MAAGLIGSYIAFCFVVSLRFPSLFGSYRRVSANYKKHPTFWHRAATPSAIYWLSPTFFLAVWIFVWAAGWGASPAFPAPAEVWTAALRLISDGTLFAEAGISLMRVTIGFVGATLVGVSIGLMAGAFLVPRQVVMPINSFIRYIPPTAFIALMIVYFGVGELYKFAVVFFGVLFFIIQMVIDAVDNVDQHHVEMGRTSGFSTWELFWQVIAPASAPAILDALRINLGAAWTFLVAAELIGAERGLGHLIAVSQRFLRLGDLFVAILAFGVIGLLTDKVLDLLGRRLFKWHYVALRQA